jgi:carboxyl-terminal processing protease
MDKRNMAPLKQGRRWFIPLGLVLVVVLCIGVALDRLVARDSTYSYLRLFNEVLLLVDRNYVEETELTDLMEGAYDGLLSSLDPESEYLTHEQYQQLMATPGPDDGDVGMELSRRGGYLFVVSVVSGSPADQAGVVSGTRLRRLEGISTREMTLTEARLALRGAVGTQVVVQRFPGEEEEELVLERARIRLPAPVAERVGQSVVLRIPDLSPGTASRARRALRDLSGPMAGTFLIDLRGASVGQYEEVARMASLFLDDGEVGRIRGRDGSEQILEVKGESLKEELRVAVLVDRGTAGPGELLTQALRHRLGAEVLGTRTFGRASLQEFIPLEDGGMIRLSVARCVGPDGESWERDGVEPDQEVEMDSEAVEDEDSVLLKALELLESDDEPVLKAA